MRRSIVTMSLVAVVLSTPAAAQSALTLGLAATLGGGWQIEGGDIGLVRRIAAGPFRRMTATARFGSFIDEGAIIGGAKGFIGGVTLGLKTGSMLIAELGDEKSPTQIGADLTLEAGGWLGSNSPLPQGSSWASLALLPGLRFGSGDGMQYSLMLGPAVFFGRSTDMHAFLGVRFEAPLARRAAHP
ncbi:MAG TPA: hypothetical protein VNH63_09915 [Gemmatimonadales bacterium]|nr:hypothetical protein [Gemmatimonadales bacterium]